VKAGRITGWIGLVLSVVAIVVFILIIVAAVSNHSSPSGF
jgi:hypothetical protein